MEIKKVIAKAVKDSRGEKTIQVSIKTNKGLFKASAPSGKSTGRFEVKAYANGLKSDINIINSIDVAELNGFLIERVKDFLKLERRLKKTKRMLGGNSLFALEACLLKALAKENKQELWEFLWRGGRLKAPHPVGNAIGGGLHSKGKNEMKPEFQEFLFIPNCKSFKRCVEINKIAYKTAKKILRTWRRNDEGAWETNQTNEQVLEIMTEVQKIIKEKYKERIEIGLDIAASSFYNGNYNYKNPGRRLNKKNQISYVRGLIKRYKLFYVEDPLYETDMSGFAEINKEKCFIVGDDLIATNPERLKKAIRLRAINAVIVKPNQIGSLVKTKEVIDLAHKHNIKTIISHRSGETMETTIADLGVGWNCDFIKTGIYGKVREAKLNRLIEIEKKLKRK
tara:strand:- start:11298 stop:12482 length:1185 start_codon:yes stop_codon:yes gene_type:complete